MVIYTLSPLFSQLQKAHETGRCLLSIYPENIRFYPETGRAVFLSPKKQTLSTGYSAPEQYKEVPQTGPWTDVYQLGALLYRMLAGIRLADVMTRAENDSETARNIDALDLAPTKKEVLLRAISLSRNERFVDINELLESLGIETISEYNLDDSNLLISAAASVSGSLKNRRPRKKLDPKKKKRIIFTIITCVVITICAVTGIFIATYNQARAHFLGGDFAQASEMLSKLPNIGPIKDLKQLSEAGVLIANGEYDKVRVLLNNVEESADSKYLLEDIDLLQGLHLIKMGEFHSGETMITRYIEEHPDIDALHIAYQRGEAYLEGQEYMIAEDIFFSLGSYEDSYTKALSCALNIADNYIKEENYQDALDIIEKYQEDPRIEELLNSIYQRGIDYLSKKRYDDAKKCFLPIQDYRDSQNYVNIIDAVSYADIAPYMDMQVAIDKVNESDSILYGFLVGTWSGGAEQFVFSDNNKVDTSLPSIGNLAKAYFLDNILFTSTNEKVTECFRFTAIDKDTLEIYAYANRKTYSMHRQ